jgi:hypothetical protein
MAEKKSLHDAIADAGEKARKGLAKTMDKADPDVKRR